MENTTTNKAPSAKSLDNVLLRIAKRNVPGLETLSERKSDSLDFHEVSVLGLRQALAEAFEAGQAYSSISSNGGR